MADIVKDALTSNSHQPVLALSNGGSITWIMRVLHLYGTLGTNENGVGGQWKAATTRNNPHLGLAFVLQIERASICLGSPRDGESGTKRDAKTNAVRIRK